MDIQALRKIASESDMLDSLANLPGADISAKMDEFNQKRKELEDMYDVINNNRDLLESHGEYNNVFDWYRGNKDIIDRSKQFSSSPLKNILMGDYEDTRNNLDFYDKLISEDTAEYKYGRKFLTGDQLKSLDNYKRWRPLIALWMNLRGLFHSLTGGKSSLGGMNILGKPTSSQRSSHYTTNTSSAPYRNYRYPQQVYGY